jgi:hypothetical protein
MWSWRPRGSGPPLSPFLSTPDPKQTEIFSLATGKATNLFCAHLPVVKNCSFQNIRGERWALIVRR